MTTPTQSTPHREQDSPSDQPALWGVRWSPTQGVQAVGTVAEIAAAAASADELLWIDLVEPSRQLVDEVASALDLHPLVAEDIHERNQRAKIELYDDQLNMVMFGLAYDGEIVVHEVDIVLAERFLVSGHDPALDLRGTHFARRDDRTYLARGPDHVLWAIADWLVDGYFPVFDRLGDEIEDLQADVMRKPSSWVVERIFQVRRDLLLIRHAVSPQREIFNQLTNRDLTLVSEPRVVYFRDVYDHLIRLTDELDSYRELVGTTLDIYVSQVNNNLSEIMKRLTAVTAILATIAAVGGIFGMSEAGAAFNLSIAPGFWIVTFIAILMAVGVGVYFRRRGWV